MIPEKIYFLTSNKHKFAEMNAVLGNLEMIAVELPEIQSLDFHEIAKYKLAAARKLGYEPCIVDDTGVCCEGLGGLPGPFTKFFREIMDDDQLYRVLTSGSTKKATARTVVGLAIHGEDHFFEGSLHGAIVPARGTNGFGVDPLFLPDGFTKTYAEMTDEEKTAISMRGQAARKVKAWLEQHG